MFESCDSVFALARLYGRSASLSVACEASLGSVVTLSSVSAPQYLFVFALTCLLEAPFYGVVAWRKGFTPAQILRQVLGVNLATHPLVFWVFPLLFAQARWPVGAYWFSAELFAPIVEGWLLAKAFRYSKTLAFATAFTANLFSWNFGLWLSENLPVLRAWV